MNTVMRCMSAISARMRLKKTRVHHISSQRNFDRSHLCLLGDLSSVAMSIETVQEQMAAMALRQQQTEQMLQQTAGVLQQSQQQATAAATAAGHSASSQSMSMVDTRLSEKPERWNGEDKSRKDSHVISWRADKGRASGSVLCAKLSG